MSFTARTWVDLVDQVDAANFNDLENRINSAVSSAVSAISNSQTMLSGTVNLSGSNIVTVKSTTGNAFVIDASTSQSVQTQGLVAAISNSQASRSGTVNISGAGIVNVGTQTGNAFTISASQSVQTQGLVAALSYSNTTKDGTVRIAGAGIVTVASDASGAVVSASQSVQPVGSAVPGGNTTGTTASLPLSGNLGLVAGANVTISQSTGAASTNLTISAASQSAQTQNLHNVTLSGNTSGALAQISSGTLTLAGGNNITLSQAGNAVTISGPNVAGAQTGISGLVASDATYSSGTVQFSGSNAATIRSSAGQRVIVDVPTQTVQPVGSLGVSGNTAGTTASLPLASNFKLAGGPNITLSQSSGTNSTVISVSADAPQTGISSIVGSDATYTSGSVQFTGSNMVTVRSSANQRIVIDATQSVQPIGSAVPAGNTAGTTASLPFSGNVGLAGGANITISQSTGAASTNLTIIGGAGAGGFAEQITSGAGGATTGTTALMSTGTVTLAAGNNITLSQAAGNAVTISAPNTTVQTVNTLDYFDNAGAMGASNGVTQTAMTFNTLLIQPLTPFNEAFPGVITASTVMLQFSHNHSSTANSSSHSSTVALGIYTRANATQLSLLNSVQTTWAQAAATNQTASYHGQRWITIHSSLWSSQPAFSQAQYWMAMFVRSSNFSTSGSFIGAVLQGSGQRSGTIMSSAATNQSMQHYPFMGIHATSQTAFPATIGATQINAATALAPFVPNVVLNNITQAF